jgi:hypothetical protein
MKIYAFKKRRILVIKYSSRANEEGQRVSWPHKEHKITTKLFWPISNVQEQRWM